MFRRHLLLARTGWLVQQSLVYLTSTTPAAAFIEASPYRARASRASAFPSSAEEGSFVVPNFKVSHYLFPGRVDGLADQHSRIGARPRTELLEPSGIHFSDVEVPFLVRTHAVDAPERAWKIGDGSPRVDEMAVEIVLQHLV